MGENVAYEGLLRLYAKVDGFFEEAVQAQPGAFLCAPGCDGCCEVDLSVFEVEAQSLADFFATLSAPDRQRAAERARHGHHCVFLDDQGRCLVYERRPLICRSHGLAVQVGGGIDHCPLNFSDREPDPRWVLDIDRLNVLLVAVNRMAGGDGRRIPLAAIALGKAP